MLAKLSRSRSLRGGGHGTAAAAAGGNGATSVGGPAGGASTKTTTPTSPPTNTSSTSTNHANGQGKPHGPTAALSLLSTMVVPTTSTSSFLSSASSSSSSTSISSSLSTTNTAASSVTTSTETSRVSPPTLKTSTVLGLVENKPAPPSPGLDGKRECPYVNRPLPPPPPPKNSETMPSRPNTSAGAGAKRTVAAANPVVSKQRANFDRRISRDDMFLGTQAKKATAFDKRISRDDLYLGTRPPAARSAAFHIPLRGQLPTPEESPNLGMAAPVTLPVRMATPESLMSGEIQIGMALGSPIHSSPPELRPFQQPKPPHQPEPATYPEWEGRSESSHDSVASSAASNAGATSTANTTPITTGEVPMQRSKTTRRKLFGIFGSKRHQDPVKSTLTGPASSYSLDGSESSSIMMTTAAAATSAERPLTRSGTKKYQPIVIQIQPEPATTTNIAALTGGAAPSPAVPLPPTTPAATVGVAKEARVMRPFLRTKASEPAMRQRPEISRPIPITLGNAAMGNLNPIQPVGSDLMSPPPPSMLRASPYLDVDIPDVRMERYSVMFGGLLPTNGAWQPASSLLARRQATLDKLKTINDRMHQEDLERDRAAAAAADAFVGMNGAVPGGGLQRRATSPHVTKSPSFSLFPSRSPNNVPNPMSPRLRSNTSPAAMLSPARTGFDFLQPPSMAKPQVQQAQRFINPLRGNPTMINRKEPTAPAPAAKPVVRFDPMQSNLILDSPTDMDYPEEGGPRQSTQDAQPFKPVLQEPQWQMISPPPPSTGSTSSAASNESATSQLLRSNTVELDEPDNALKSAVEISIARQISISRQQRQLLRPLQTHNIGSTGPSASTSSTPPSSTSSPSRSATLKLGRNERLQETKTATPTLVVADSYNYNTKPSSSSGLAQSQSRPRMQYVPPRSNANLGSNLQAYQLAQNRKSERVVLEAA